MQQYLAIINGKCKRYPGVKAGVCGLSEPRGRYVTSTKCNKYYSRGYGCGIISLGGRLRVYGFLFYLRDSTILSVEENRGGRFVISRTVLPLATNIKNVGLR